MIAKTGKATIDSQIIDVETSLIAELQKLDLTANEAKILVVLFTQGQSNASDISFQTGIQRTEIYSYISSLLAKGILFSTFDRPQKYYSLPVEEVIGMLTQAKRKALDDIDNKKDEYRNMVQAIIGNNRFVQPEDSKERYNVVMGENAISAKIERMLAGARRDVITVMTERNLINFYHAGLSDQLVQLATKGISVKLRTACKNASEYISPQSTSGDDSNACGIASNDLSSSTLSSKSPSPSIMLLVNTIEKSAPIGFVIVDNREMIVLLDGNPLKKSEIYGFYTNNQSMISAFKFMFENIT